MSITKRTAFLRMFARSLTLRLSRGAILAFTPYLVVRLSSRSPEAKAD